MDAVRKAELARAPIPSHWELVEEEADAEQPTRGREAAAAAARPVTPPSRRRYSNSLSGEERVGHPLGPVVAKLAAGVVATLIIGGKPRETMLTNLPFPCHTSRAARARAQRALGGSARTR